MILGIVFIIIQLTFVIFFLYMCIASLTGAPFVPSSNPTTAAMAKLANIKKGSIVYDLGSGDGKVLFAAAALGARAVGFEINPILVLYTNIRAYFSPHRHKVHAVWKNFWSADIHDADAVFIYLLPWKMERLAQKLQKELKPTARIVSNSFIFPNWQMEKEDRDHHVYVFRTVDEQGKRSRIKA